ncbi:MAG: DUF3828 domain-containing protein [Bdellovibrionota bacterium]
MNVPVINPVLLGCIMAATTLCALPREVRAANPMPVTPASSAIDVPADLKTAVEELKKVYALDVKSVLSMSDEEAGDVEATSAEDLLAEHNLLTPDLRKHIDESGGLDFDILLSAQDWEKSWTFSVEDPKKSGEGYDVKVVLKHPKEQATVVWKFVHSDGKWFIDDATYSNPREKPFTLRSLNEGD